MPGHDPRAIANEFLRRRGDDTWPQQLVVQKLTYIAHGWSLAITNEPLVNERPEAWDNGPVFRSIWDHIKAYGYRGRHCTLKDEAGNEFKADVSSKEAEIIDHVWRKYGDMSSKELSNMTHQPDTPWYRAYFGKHRNAHLSNRDVRDHYVKLAMAGRAEQR